MKEDQQTKESELTLSVIIPCYNEAEFLETIIERVRKVGLANEIVIIDDGSVDGSRDILKRLEEEDGNDDLRIIYHERNQGKGAALVTGFAAATSDILLIQDADLEYDPAQYPKLVGPILSGDADVVYGSRFMGGEAHRVLYFWHRMGNGFLTLFSNMLTNLNLTDMETCYKVFRREIIQSINIEENRFGFEPEITAKIAKKQCRIYEIGISYYGRTYDDGKKIGWRDGVRSLYCIIKYNLFR